MLVPIIYWAQKIWGQKNVSWKNILGPKINGVPKKFGLEKDLSARQFFKKKIGKRIFGPKQFWVQKILRFKIIPGPKKFWIKIFFLSEKFWVHKNFGTWTSHDQMMSKILISQDY